MRPSQPPKSDSVSQLASGSRRVAPRQSKDRVKPLSTKKPLHAFNPIPASLNPDAFLPNKLSKVSGHHGSNATLHDELETLSHVKSKLNATALPPPASDLATSRTNNTPQSEEEDVSRWFVTPDMSFDPHHQNGSPEANKKTHVFAYHTGGNKYKNTQSSMSRREWDTNTKLTPTVEKGKAGVASKNKNAGGGRLKTLEAPDNRLRSMGFGSNTSLDETINTPETEKPITPGNSSESNSEASICSSTASLSASKSATAASTPSTAPLNDEDHFKSLSISNLEKAPSLPFLSNLQPERATTATLLIANCKGCARPISSAQACLSAIGFMWHSECFKCANTQCAKQIGQGSFYQRGRFCYCESCWKGDCCPKCEECGNPIDDRKEQTLVQGHAYHKTCFTCSLCEKPLLPMTQFVEPGGVRCCLPCYAEVHGKRCRGCGDMCTADFVSVSRGHTYHKVCITCSVCYRTLEDCHTFYQQGGVFFCDEHHTPDEARKVSGEEKSEAEYEVDEKNTYVDESTIANSSSGEHTS